jgi:sporulation protein YunB
MGRRRVYFYISPKLIKVIVPILALLMLFIVVEKNLRDTIFTVAGAKATQAATEAINQAIAEKVVGSVDYRELIHIVQDNNGRIVLMQANTLKLNKIASDTTLAVQQKLRELGNEKFNIPLGQALGSKLLASYGPLIKVVIVPIGTVQVKVSDDFDEAGINQTKHRLLLNVETKVRVVIPLTSTEATVKNQVPITETVLIGEIPQTYIKLNLGERALNP